MGSQILLLTSTLLALPTAQKARGSARSGAMRGRALALLLGLLATGTPCSACRWLL